MKEQSSEQQTVATMADQMAGLRADVKVELMVDLKGPMKAQPLAALWVDQKADRWVGN